MECMATTSKSPQAVLRVSLAVAERSLRPYSHKHSPKKFTQQQLFACLVLKSFLNLDYRGVVAHLSDCPALQEVLGLTRVPHFTTLQKAAKRLLSAPLARRLLEATVREQMGRRQRVPLAAIDATGLECTSASSYFVRRRAHVKGPWKSVSYRRFPKLTVICDVDSHFILACKAQRGPKNDSIEFRPLIEEALQHVHLNSVVADAGYDSESNHRFAREEEQIRTTIPPKCGRPTGKPATGRYRRLMQVRFNTKAYRQRAQVETVMSMIKRRQGAFARGLTYWSQCRDLHLKALTHNIMSLFWQ